MVRREVEGKVGFVGDAFQQVSEHMGELIESFFTTPIFGDTTVGFTVTTFWFLVACIIMLIVFFAYKRRMEGTLVPHGFFANGVEYLIDFVANDTTFFMDSRRQKDTYVKNLVFDLGMQYEQPIGEKYRFMAGVTLTPSRKMTVRDNALVYTFVTQSGSEYMRDTIFPVDGDSEFESTLEQPFTTGVGLAFQRNDKWLVAFDATLAPWNGLKYTENSSYSVFGQSPIRYDNTSRLALGFQLLGDRNDDIYKDYIEDGEVEPQKLLVGGKVRWNMHRRFNGTLGFVGSKDFLDDPLLRDGSRKDVNTSSPIMSSKTFFADGNWLLFPGDIELNGQVAIGAADTANATLQRAINEVFVDAGLDASNLSRIRRLMNNPTLVDFMSYEELEEFFGDNTMKTKSELQRKLKSLLAQAKALKNRYSAEDESSTDLKNWDGQNLAFTGSLHWNLGKTTIFGYVRYVGADYYSAGSPDLLQNSREVYGSLDRKIFDFWMLNFNYKINVENAAHGEAYNVFGLAEGEKMGLIPGADEKWLAKHEQDEDRTLYEHELNFNNDFKVNKFWELSVGYNMNYRTRSTNQRLFGDYSSESGVFDDSWFEAYDGRSTVDVVRGDDTLKIDSVRWAQYYALRNQPYLATEFNERIIRNTFKLGFKFNLPKNTLKVGGVWTLRRDMSKFEQDELLDEFDFSDETYGLLGYYFHGGDYFEQRYPVSLTTTVGGFRNMFSVTPRYKIFNRDDMTDFEWNVADNMTIPLSKDFLDLLLSASFRQEFQKRDEEGKRISESEMDVSGSGTLRFTHTGNLTSEWTIGAYCAYRPDYKADEYKDLFGTVSLSYSF